MRGEESAGVNPGLGGGEEGPSAVGGEMGRGYAAIATALLLLTLVPRFWDILKFLPDYMIDENDIVEMAVGFLGGDLRPPMPRYGPLYGYILALVYRLWAAVVGSDPAELALNVFFRPTGFYYLARFMNSCLNLLMVVVSYRIARRCLGKRTAAIALLLAIFPFADLLTAFKVRVDTLLGLWSSLAVLFALRIVDRGQVKDYVLAGLFFALGVASKPLPALLVLPTVLLAHYLSVVRDEKRGALLCIPRALLDLRLHSFLIASVVLFLAVNPFALIDFQTFWDRQVGLILNEGSRPFPPGWHLSRFYARLGPAFVLASVFSTIYFLGLAWRKRKDAWLVLVSYPFVFWLAFAPGASRNYFYVPIIPVITILIAKLIRDAESRLPATSRGREALCLVLVLLVVGQPAWNLLTSSIRMNRVDYRKIHTGLAGKDWIENHLAPGTRILLYGFYTDLPRLVDSRAKTQARIGEYFMNDRHRSSFLRERFKVAHKRYLEEGRPGFLLNAFRRFKGGDERLLEYCRRQKIRYVVSTFDLTDYPGFENTRIKSFDRSEYEFGQEFAIYRLDRSGPATDGD